MPDRVVAALAEAELLVLGGGINAVPKPVKTQINRVTPLHDAFLECIYAACLAVTAKPANVTDSAFSAAEALIRAATQSVLQPADPRADGSPRRRFRDRATPRESHPATYNPNPQDAQLPTSAEILSTIRESLATGLKGWLELGVPGVGTSAWAPGRQVLNRLLTPVGNAYAALEPTVSGRSELVLLEAGALNCLVCGANGSDCLGPRRTLSDLAAEAAVALFPRRDPAGRPGDAWGGRQLHPSDLRRVESVIKDLHELAWTRQRNPFGMRSIDEKQQLSTYHEAVYGLNELHKQLGATLRSNRTGRVLDRVPTSRPLPGYESTVLNPLIELLEQATDGLPTPEQINQSKARSLG